MILTVWNIPIISFHIFLHKFNTRNVEEQTIFGENEAFYFNKDKKADELLDYKVRGTQVAGML